MNYELAKQLKDAGFPQKEHGVFSFPPVGSMDETSRMRGMAYEPTLSELIEVCGYGFYNLRKTTKWYAAALFVPIDIREVWGDTPEEAVAKLWIALNHKP